jgi:hypothetical protein
MAGPYPPRNGGAEGQPFPGSPGYPSPVYPEPYPYPAAYPGPLPPPVAYPPPQRSKALLWTLLGLGLVGVLVATALFTGVNRSGGGGAKFTESNAKTAIQNYLTALSDGDTETIARNTLCGMFDAIRDRKSDMALARLASDAFRKQFAQADVMSIDKIVTSSSYQAQVLFTMKVAPASSSRRPMPGSFT